MALAQSSLYLNFSATEAIPSAGGGTDNHSGSLSMTASLANGTGVGAAQKVGDLLVTTTTSITNLDLTAFAGGINAATINFSKIKWFAITNSDATNSITVTLSGTNGCTNLVNGTFTLGPGETRVIVNNGLGITVDSTHKIIGLTAVAATPQAHITIVGEGV